MPIPALALAGGSLLAKGLGALFGHKAQSSQSNANREALINLLTVRQNMSEDQRLARVKLAQSILANLPEHRNGPGGGYDIGGPRDPALYADLGKRRNYDFSSTVPKSAGGFESFLSGLFGGAADVIPRVASPDASAAGPVGGIDSGVVAGGFSPAPIGGPSSPTAPNITLEQLLEEQKRVKDAAL